MTGDSFERRLHDLARVLSEIAHTLEATDDPTARIERVLHLANSVIPYRRCSLLEIENGRPSRIMVVPPTDGGECARLTERLTRVYDLIAHVDSVERPTEISPSLTLPVIGLDSIVGVIRVEPARERYEVTHLRVLSVIAAQLGAYFTTLRLRETDRQRADELEAAHAFQQRLTGIVGHDLRTPLTVISTVASTLLLKTTDEQQLLALRRAQRNVDHAARLIADLLDVTETRVTGTMRIAPCKLGVLGLVETCVEDLRTAHPSHPIELASELDAATEATWDPDRIQQLITNLLGNAIAHGAPESPVRLTCRSAGDAVSIVVHNAGAPIPPELLPTIFDPFHHGAARPRPSTARGLGLGLYIVSQIVQAHGGHVEVASSAGDGTMFSVHLPRHTLAVPHVQLDAGKVVMIVDDDAEVRLGMSALLEKRGYEVVCAANGEEALQLLHAGFRPSLVFLDLSMPIMDGTTLWQHCQANAELSKLPFVVITADTAAAVRIDQPRAVLQKPVSMAALLATLDEPS